MAIRYSKTEKLIKEVEENGKKLYEYMAQENQHELDDDIPSIYDIEWAGNTIAYEYNGNKYEITTWNENSKKHDDGHKTIKEI
jgi:hypothetical protein